MRVIVNGEKIEVADQATVADLLQSMGFTDTRGLAVAVNEAIHPRSGWDGQILPDDAQVTLIRAAQGG